MPMGVLCTYVFMRISRYTLRGFLHAYSTVRVFPTTSNDE